MNTIVVYASKYGSTAQYARWLGEGLNAPVKDVKAVSTKELSRYDCIVYGGGIYAGGIKGIGRIRKISGMLQGKRLAIFAVGATPPSEEVLETVRKRNLAGDLASLPLFYLHGTYDYSLMKPVDKLLCRMLRRSLQKKPEAELAEWERAMVKTEKGRGDWKDKAAVAPLVQWVQQGV